MKSEYVLLDGDGNEIVEFKVRDTTTLRAIVGLFEMAGGGDKIQLVRREE